MITVVIQKDQLGSYKGFYCMGHAEYAERGHDVVCAAVSALTIGTVNSLEQLAGEQLDCATDQETGFLRCRFEDVLQEKSSFLVDSMILSLETISEQYGKKYLQVKFEEV